MRRDPLKEKGHKVLNPESLTPIDEIFLYLFLQNDPINKWDPNGLWVYNGYCRFISGGEIIGVGQIRCRVWTPCMDDNTYEIGEIVGMFGGVTAGVPIGITYFNIAQDSRDFSKDPTISDLIGYASVYSISSAFGFGSSVTALNLGITVGEYMPENFQAGFDASADALGGFSWLDWSERKCCSE